MSEPETRLEYLKKITRELRSLSREIRKENVTTKTTGGKYPIQLGYTEAVRRPVGDLLKWMDSVEAILFILVDELEKGIHDIE